jgi:hypothetical protein
VCALAFRTRRLAAKADSPSPLAPCAYAYAGARGTRSVHARKRTEQLADTTTGWASLIAPIAERVAAMLGGVTGARLERLPTPLTNGNRLVGRGAMRRTSLRRSRVPRPAVPKPTPICKACGGEVPHSERDYCNTCLPEYQREQFEQRFSGSGLAKLERLKIAGQDPTHGGNAKAKRADRNRQRKAELAVWERQYGKLVDLSVFAREIQPLIRDIPLSRLVAATGLSLRYVSQIRRGERIPHPRHWGALTALRSES